MHAKSILQSLFLVAAIAPVSVLSCCGTGGTTLQCLGKSTKVCDDLTSGTPCCGNGKCNVFCCNCDRGCRKSSNAIGITEACNRIFGSTWRKTSRSLGELSDLEDDKSVLAIADTDKSGDVSLAEYLQYMGQREDNAEYVNWFKQHDRNGDGVLSDDELRLA
ncbi:hypothetical protein BU25DRAFT_446474 [Macroventuria anomochaeta]|uniref:Uncharacterized protein n=1 Tax=Macroventuria anomochaeta TaxID=301207 RepID=A0ACB6S9D8_9PLEO|nr:uncharacterized protein BU25DRAFT_446474 [Macroventuria anomochaeta]KAF2630906.1 hypothetical protein BU25DRAFT_446474 [Macroventuria anomochaeta]